MVTIAQLWMPVLLAAVAVFIVSSVIHMALPWHAGDFKKLPQEDQVLGALRPFSIAPGDYMGPRPDSMKDMGSEAFKQKLALGPRVIMTVMPPGTFGMGKNLAAWFVYALVLAAVVGGMDCLLFRTGADWHDVFHVSLIAGTLAYGGAHWQAWIWYDKNLVTTVKNTIDAVIYAAVTAGLLAFFWPS